MMQKIKLDGAPLIEIAKKCGVAPCQILAVNNVQNERELATLETIFVPVNYDHLIHLK